LAYLVADAADMNGYGLSVVSAAVIGLGCWRWRSFVWHGSGARGVRRV